MFCKLKFSTYASSVRSFHSNVIHCTTGMKLEPRSFNRVIMSGIQPTGIPHLGNLFGAIEIWRDLQDSAQSSDIIISVVDLHSITVPQDPNRLRQSITDMIATLLACGINNKKTILFQQSAVLAHANLSWVLGCLTSIAKLEHLPQWKEKYGSSNESLGEVPLGLFTYPVLQAADILIYKATHVPVGDDQLKHIELARHLAKTFNNRYGYLFPQPQAITVEFKRIRSLRNPEAKMGKSDKDPLSRIELLDSPDRIREKIRKAVTDFTPNVTYDPSQRPGVSNLVDILSACSDQTAEEICESSLHLDTAGFKSRVADAIIERLRPIKEEFIRLKSDQSYLNGVIKEGNDRASEIANSTYDQVRRSVGLV